MDVVHLLFQQQLVPVKIRSDYNIMKQEITFLADSYWEYSKKTLQKGGDFLKDLLRFSQDDKDNISPETIELMQPYLELTAPDGRQVYDPLVAATASAALKGLCTWSAAMSDYHKQSKIVRPKLRLLEIKSVQLKEAQDDLASAEKELEEVQALQARLKAKYDGQMAEKNALQEKANKTKKKMEQANRLINSL
jgi:dynein heavy chain